MAGDDACVDVLVLGAGISGLVSASVLLEQGERSILVVDEYDHVGGNHLDSTAGGYTFDVGSLIFQDDSPLLRHFPELLERYVPIEPSWSRLTPRGVVTEYPFSLRDDVLAAGPWEVARMVASAVLARTRRREPTNAKEFAERWLGRHFVDKSGLGTYMERFCGLPTEQIDLEFAQSRMMWIADHGRLASLVRRAWRSGTRSSPEPAATNRQMARPPEGFAYLYEPVVARLRARGVAIELGLGLRSLRATDGSFVLDTDERRVVARRVVSTVPVDRALDLCGLRTGTPLPTVSLISLYVSFAGHRNFDTSVLYNFSHTGAWKRLTVYSDFYGRRGGREYFTVEVIAGRVDGSVAAAYADFCAHTRDNGLFDGDLTLEGSHVLDHAYPIYTRGSGAQAREAIAALRAYGIESLGRQGGFQYQPTARASTVEAEAVLARSPRR